MIYLDNAATTRIDDEVYNEMLPYLKENYGNASSIYRLGNISNMAIYDASDNISSMIGANPDDIVFTSGATESNNWALIAVYEMYHNKGNHIITTKIEHESILKTCEYLSKYRDAKITYLDVDENGFINIDELKSAINEDTILVSIMFANNEIGTIQDIEKIGMVCKGNNIILHTDAVQAFTKVKIDVDKYNIDLMSLSAHKIHGPKGVGALYIRGDTKLKSFIHGGSQQRKKRAGTENVAGIVGFGKAALISRNVDFTKIKELRDYFIKKVQNNIDKSYLNGSITNRLCNNINMSFDGTDSENLVIALDMKGVCVSSGSACTAGSIEPSHVLKAIGKSLKENRSSIRVTLSKYTTKDELDKAIDILKKIVEENRRIYNS